jgi:hypothetical protein
VPTRPLAEIANEYVEAFNEIYEPEKFLDRTYRCFRQMGAPRHMPPAQFPELIILRALFLVIWRQGIVRSTRWKFWHHLVGILVHNPKVFDHYLSVCAQNEHFMEYRDIVRQEIGEQLAELPDEPIVVSEVVEKVAA